MDKNKTFFSRLYKSKYFPVYLMEKKTQQVTSLIFTLVALSFFGLFAISPTLSTIAQLQKELSDSKDVYQKLVQKIHNIAALSAEYSKLEQDIHFVNETLPQTS